MSLQLIGRAYRLAAEMGRGGLTNCFAVTD